MLRISWAALRSSLEASGVGVVVWFLSVVVFGGKELSSNTAESGSWEVPVTETEVPEDRHWCQKWFLIESGLRGSNKS